MYCYNILGENVREKEEDDSMKRIMTVFAKAANFAAVVSAGAVSFWGLYQAKIPTKLQK